MVPDRLAGWTLATLEALCAAGQPESDRHDFKLGLQDARNTTKICCAFANTFGGFLVIGIRDRMPGQFAIEGIDPNKELYSQLTQKVRADPDITITPPTTISIPESRKLVYVFEVPQSSHRPHLPKPADERIFWKRHGSDCEPMTLEEVRYQMNVYEEKREKLALLLMELHHIVRSLSEQANMQEGTYNGSIFTFDIIDRVTVESYSILKADPNIIGALDTLKKRLMSVNAEKQKLLSQMVFSPDVNYRKGVANLYRQFASSTQSEVLILSEQIARSLKERFGIDNPYPMTV